MRGPSAAADIGDELAGVIAGDVVHGCDDAVMFYAADAGPFAARPAAAAVPRDEDDVAAAVRLAAGRGIPVTVRGGGTGLAGGAVGHGIVLDMRLLDRVEFDGAGRGASVRAAAGAPRGAIDALLAGRGHFLGPNPSVGPYCTAGGMVATNASGSRSLKYGSIIDNLLGVRIIDGLGRAADLPADGRLSARILSAAAGRAAAPAFPAVAKNSCGYRIDALATAADSHKVFAGSEGTLGVVVSARLRVAREPEWRRLCVIACRSPADAAADCLALRSASPSALEYVDRHALSGMGGMAPAWAACALLAEFDGTAARRAALSDLLPPSLRGAVAASTADEAEMRRWWRLRDTALSRTLGLGNAGRGPAWGGRRRRSPPPPAHVVEDAAVPPARVGDLLALIASLEGRFGLRAIVYGHIGSGNLHVRLAGEGLDGSDGAGAGVGAAGAHSASLRPRMRRIAEWYFERVVAMGGTISGEHGDGLARTWFVGRQYGAAAMGRFAALKALLDPCSILNPGKVLPAPAPRPPGS